MIPGIGIGVGYYPESYGGGWNPYVLANLAARYDLSNTSSYITATGVKLLGDLSGNSNVNVWANNSLAGSNYATFTALTPYSTGDFTVAIKVQTPGAFSTSHGMFGSPANGLAFFISAAGFPQTAKDNVANNTASTTQLAVNTVYTLTYVRSGTTGTYYVNAVTAGTTSDSRDYSVGTDRLGCLNTTTLALNGLIFNARVYSAALNAAAVLADYNGTVQANNILNIDFSLAAKLAASFTVTTGGTVTINTSGDHGARICGARDQVEMTAARQPTVSGNTLSFSSAASQHTQSARFSFPQPNTIFLVGSLTTWASGTYMLDGDTANTMGLTCTTGTPKMSMNAGSNAAENSNLTVGQRSIFMLQFNGASSSFQINATTATTGNPGAGTPNGITIGALGSVVNFSDMNMNELIAYTGAMDGATIAQVRAYLAAKWSVTL